MVFNFTRNWQFNSRLHIDDERIEEVQECRLLGLTINSKLTWQNDTEIILKKAYTDMIMLHKLAEFKPPIEDMVTIYTMFTRRIVEYQCVIWRNSINMEERTNNERIQKTALGIILGEPYTNDESALKFCG